jgi:hypothetical protein
MAEPEEPMEERSLIRIRLKLDPDSWHEIESEGIWVKFVRAVGDKAIVEVNNIPFFSKSISYFDRLIVTFSNNTATIDGIAERSGHSTYRVFVEYSDDRVSNMLEILKEKGCEWERAGFRGGDLYALDIPPEANIYDVYELLEEGQKEGVWLFEEGYVGHPIEGGTTLQ